MNTVATPMPVAATKQPKIVTLSDAERSSMQTMLDNHALILTEKIDEAIENDNYVEAQRLAGILVKTADCLRVLTK